MKCPMCRSGELAWAWTLDWPEFRVGKGRCQNFDCRAEFIITRAASEEEAATIQELAVARPATDAVQ